MIFVVIIIYSEKKIRKEPLTPKQPDGDDDAKVAFTTNKTEHTVTYQRLAVDQLCGFSTSPSLKSTCPFSLRYGRSPGSRSAVLYGFAVGRDRMRPRFTMLFIGKLIPSFRITKTGVKNYWS